MQQQFQTDSKPTITRELAKKIFMETEQKKMA